jgi:hypothetical protein
VRITDVTRRNIIDWMILRPYPFFGRLDLIDFLNRIWDLSSMPSTDPRHSSAQGDIRQHVLVFPDWDYHHLLYTYLGILAISDEQFNAFLESCVHPLVLDDEAQLEEMLYKFNEYLVPDGYTLVKSSMISGKLIYKVISIGSDTGMHFDIVLSFAGEERGYVEPVAEFLKENRVSFFYDKYEEATLWGKELTEHLDRVFRGNARYCIMFISKNYAEKVWPTQERRSALAKAVRERDEYILPVRFDKTEIPGIRPSIVYIDATKKSPRQLGELILEKLGKRKEDN